MHGPQTSTLTFRNVSLIHTWRPCCDSAVGISEKRVGKVKDIKIAGGGSEFQAKFFGLIMCEVQTSRVIEFKFSIFMTDVPGQREAGARESFN